MGALFTIGRILTLIGGILAIVLGLLGVINRTLDVLDSIVGLTPVSGGGSSGVLGNAIVIVLGILLIFIYIEKIEIKDKLVLGIVIIVIALVADSLLAIVGGILIVIDKLVE